MWRRRSSGASASRANTGSLIREGETGARGSTVTFHQARIEAVVPYRTRREWLNIQEASAGSEFSVGGCRSKFFLFCASAMKAQRAVWC